MPIEYTGTSCEYGTNTYRCPDHGQVELFGYCADHWSKLSAERRSALMATRDAKPDPYCGMKPKEWLKLTELERSVLLSQRVSQPPNVTENHQHEHHVHHPPRSRLLDFVIAMAGASSGVAGWHFLSRAMGW